MTETPRGEKMDLKQPPVDHRQPQEEKHCPNAPPEAQEAAQAAPLGKQVPSAGAQSHVPSLQSPCSSPGPSCAQGTAQTLSGQWSVLTAPETEEEALASEEEKSELCHPLEPCRGENHMGQELSQEEVSSILALSQGEDNSDKTLLHENWSHITIRTIWVNPKHPELLRDPLQAQAEAPTPSASDEQVPASGAQSPVPDSPCCSPFSSRSRLAAQTRRGPQGVPGQPPGPRRALQALCTLLWCSCVEVRL
ncbi:hypothetical protein Nmel_007475, partial [Mimus melanotis]